MGVAIAAPTSNKRLWISMILLVERDQRRRETGGCE
jgi:hypothetical protein